MARAEKFRPYASSSSERDRIQKLDEFFTWLYREYGNRDTFDYDFSGVLASLEMRTGVRWSSGQLTTYLTEQDFPWCQELQQSVRGLVVRGLQPMLQSSHPFFLVQSWLGSPYPTGIAAYEETDGVFLRRGYFLKPTEPPTLERLSHILWLRVVDVLLQGINIAAIVACAECGHFTARSHPRGKLYCSPDCRVRASLRTRRKTLTASKCGNPPRRKTGQRPARRYKPSSGNGRKEH